MPARRRNLILAGVLLLVVAAALVAVSAWRARDPFDPAQPAAATDAASMSGSASGLSGVVEGSTVDYMAPWYAVLEVRTGDGRLAHVVVNGHSRLDVAADVPRIPDAGPDEAGFPWRVAGTRISAHVKTLRFGFLGLRSVPLVVSASITRR